VALLLPEKTLSEEFRRIESVVNMYVDVDGSFRVRPLQWLDDIPDLAKKYRKKEAEPAVV
jgi:hypothetical protein